MSQRHRTSQLDKLRVTTSPLQHQITAEVLTGMKVNTVCLESDCPNVGSCFSKGLVSFLILGPVCTRSCAFCAVTMGRPSLPDPAEPFRMAAAARRLNLTRVVITSVTRDDLVDGGAGYFAQTVHMLKSGGIKQTEVLVPDFQGKESSLRTLLEAEPDAFAHNVETVPRLYPAVRRGADYLRSLRLIEKAAELSRNLPVKSGMMLGIGEAESEVMSVMKDLRLAGCDMLTLGQYLRPSGRHIPVVEYLGAGKFEEYRLMGVALGFKQVWSGALVRSSMAH